MGERDVALVTPSYAADLERCRLLCDSIDAQVRGHATHYVLVADHDHSLFAPLAGGRREIVRENDILPEPMLCVPTPGGRRAWLSTFAWPLRGWHVQQLRRIALANHVDHAALLYCDSDMAFVRPFDVEGLWHGDALRLYRIPNAIDSGASEHMAWTMHAHRLLGLVAPEMPAHDYINNLVSWRVADVRAMLQRIEANTERPWLRAVARQRAFSECQIYGAYADGVAAQERHWRDAKPLCLTRWGGEPMGEAALRRFVEHMDTEQVAIGVQSFTGTDPDLIRRVVNL